MLDEAPRIGEPESALIPGMAAPRPNPLAAPGPPNLPDTSTAAPTPPGLTLQAPGAWLYDIDPATGAARATFNGEVTFTSGGAAGPAFLPITAGQTAPLTGSLWITPTGASATLDLNTPAIVGAACQIVGLRAGAIRWIINPGNASAESGSNTGSDFGIIRYNDASAALDTPIAIARATGVCTFSQPIVNGSDRAFKRNVEPIKNALARVCELQGVAFDPIGSDHPEIGLIAQDVLKTVPEVVHEIPAMSLPDSASAEARKLYGEPRLGIAYAQLTALLIEAVKTLAGRVETLEAK
jgi:hypothetical protein